MILASRLKRTRIVYSRTCFFRNPIKFLRRRKNWRKADQACLQYLEKGKLEYSKDANPYEFMLDQMEFCSNITLYGKSATTGFFLTITLMTTVNKYLKEGVLNLDELEKEAKRRGYTLNISNAVSPK